MRPGAAGLLVAPVTVVAVMAVVAPGRVGGAGGGAVGGAGLSAAALAGHGEAQAAARPHTQPRPRPHRQLGPHPCCRQARVCNGDCIIQYPLTA